MMTWLTGEYQPPRRAHYQRTHELETQITALEKYLGLYGGCSHPITEPVDVWTGERVARLCLSCDQQLSPF